MYFTQLAVFVSSCYSLAAGAFPYHRNGLNFPFREISRDQFDSVAKVEIKSILQPVDHFNNTDQRDWSMRYFQNLQFWKNNGPVFLFVSGFFMSDTLFLRTGEMYNLAKETNGAMFLSEHRYYGESQPFKRISTENLQFLTTRQALADIAKLLTMIKSSPQFSSSKVVLCGYFYGGSLAVWMKVLYPNLVDAVWSSSGPTLAKVDFFEFIETTSDIYKRYGTPGCYEKIGETFRRYEQLLKTDDGIKVFKEEQRICDDTDMKKLLNQQLFFDLNIFLFGLEAQDYGLSGIERICHEISNSLHMFSSKDVDTKLWNETDDCMNYDFYDYIERNIENDKDYKTCYYQMCTELGFFQTTNSRNHPFTNNLPLEYSISICKALFGEEFDEKRVKEGAQKVNEMYGGLTPNVTNVIFVNGEVDPWQRISVLNELSNDTLALIIPFSGIGEDIYPPETDKEVVKKARRYIKTLIKKWIGVDPYLNNN